MAERPQEAHVKTRLIKLGKVKDYTTLSTTEIYRRISAGTFPTQVNLGPKSVAWVESEILQWCADLAAQREEG